MLSIGEFSRVTQLSIKALHLYHEKGILIPGKIDTDSKYRYYGHRAIEKGLIIKQLKEMGFSLPEIKQIVQECQDDSQLAEHVKQKLHEIEDTLRQYEAIKSRLAIFLENTKEEIMEQSDQVQRETFADMWICGIRFKGKYCEVGAQFGKLFRACGRWVVGKPFSLYYDEDYKEEDADIEACVAVKKEVVAAGINCRIMAGGEAVTLIHKGPYDELGRSYGKIYEYCRENGLVVQSPIREQYLKGPGMIFKGNPKKYITKIIIKIS